jgi:hypothetical protein
VLEDSGSELLNGKKISITTDYMQWKKLGKTFDPTTVQLFGRTGEFAQSPQALIFPDFVRIYFSTREKEEGGKYLSHIAFIDMDLTFKNILRVSEKPVISLGKLGAFDEHGIFPINPVRVDNRILAYTCGWSRRFSVSVETSTGFAESFDGGITFTKLGDGPVFSSSLHEPFLVGDSFVARFGDRFYMWYIFGKRWIENSKEEAARVYKIACAMSDDGLHFVRDSKQIIADRLNSDECQALPTVVFHNNLYHMYFCFREAIGFRKNKERGYRLGYAYSSDLKNWTRDDAKAGIDVSSTGWDSDMQCYPHLFHCQNELFLLYNGNEFGRFGFGIAKLERD